MTGPICMESVVANFTNPLPPIPLTEIESQMISRSWRLANSAETKLAPLQPVSKMKRSVRPPIVMSV